MLVESVFLNLRPELAADSCKPLEAISLKNQMQVNEQRQVLQELLCCTELLQSNDEETRLLCFEFQVYKINVIRK